MRFAVVARVTADRWVACSVLDKIDRGMKPGDELDVATTLCHEVHLHRESVVIDNVPEDAIYCTHHTPKMYGIKSYIAFPIFLSENRFFGTLCAVDPDPNHVNTPQIRGMFKLFAELIACHLNAIEQVAFSESRLQEERKNSELREQFIAVLGHDLRNPLHAIASGVELLRQTVTDPGSARVVGMMQKSVSRMSALIADVLDFARGRLGGGLSLSLTLNAALEPALNQAIAELRAVWPGRVIEARYALGEPVDCDLGRIVQLFSNLLGNALTYGTAERPVRVLARSRDGGFELAVANAGEPIAPATRERLFHPFARGQVQPNQRGLGLGLYIAAEIARAHGGTLEVASNPEETRFTLRMPCRPVPQ